MPTTTTRAITRYAVFGTGFGGELNWLYSEGENEDAAMTRLETQGFDPALALNLAALEHIRAALSCPAKDWQEMPGMDTDDDKET